METTIWGLGVCWFPGLGVYKLRARSSGLGFKAWGNLDSDLYRCSPP